MPATGLKIVGTGACLPRVAAGFLSSNLRLLRPFLRPAQIKLIPYERGRAMPILIY